MIMNDYRVKSALLVLLKRLNIKPADDELIELYIQLFC